MAARAQWSQEKFDLLFPAEFYVDPSADFGPFGSDPGWDLFEELQQRRGRARRIVRAAVAIEEDPDEMVGNAADGDDFAQALILGAAFGVIRLSGQIDAEGLGWVREVLRQWTDREGGCAEAEVMLADLERFESLGPARIEQMDVEALRDHLGLAAPEPPRCADTPSGLSHNWFLTYPDIPEPIGPEGRWGWNANQLRDPLFVALEAACFRLDELVDRFTEGGAGSEVPTEHVLHWFSDMSDRLGADFSLQVFILIGRDRPRRSYRRTRGERTVSVPLRSVEDDLRISPATADALVLAALEDAADFLAGKEGLPKPSDRQ